jgi:hypothetical protein
MYACNPIAIASKDKCTKTNPTHHDASFSTILMGPCTIGSKGYNFFKTPLQVSKRYGFPKKKSNYEKKII